MSFIVIVLGPICHHQRAHIHVRKQTTHRQQTLSSVRKQTFKMSRKYNFK